MFKSSDIALPNFGTFRQFTAVISSQVQSYQSVPDLAKQVLYLFSTWRYWMGMRRVESETKSPEPVGNPLKRVANFDDSSIRKMLRSAYTDFVGEELELQMNQNASTMVPKMSFTADKGWADLSQLQNRAELKLFWEIGRAHV